MFALICLDSEHFNEIANFLIRNFILDIGSGVSTDIWTCYAARIMAVSVIPFVVVQLPLVLKINSGRHVAVLIALIVSVLMLIAYCVYQVTASFAKRQFSLS